MKTINTLIIVTLLLIIPGYLQAQNGLHFDGSNDWVNCGTSTSTNMSGNTTLTLEAWIYPTSFKLNAFEGSIFRKEGTGTNGYMLRCGGTGVIEFVVGTGSWGVATSPSNSLVLHTWQHVAAVYNGSSMIVYVNGIQVANVSKTGSIGSSTASLGIGGGLLATISTSNTRSFSGKIDEARVWSVARSQSQITSTMNSEFCTIPTGLKAYHKFNTGTAGGSNAGLNSSIDASGNGNNGTLTGISLSGSTSNWVTGASLTTGALSGGTTNITGCIPYITLGNQTLTTSGMYQDTAILSSGCDSTYTINFTPLQPTYGSITTTECDFLIAPSGNVYSASGTYVDTINNTIGCDSLITINLTIHNSSSTNITTTNCNNYVGPSGTVYTTSGTFVDTLPNTLGCDSLVTLNLTIINGYFVTLNENACISYTSPSGTVLNTSGTYYDTIVNGTGCDSIFTINLTIYQSTSVTITESACDMYVSNNGNTYTTTGMYTEIIGNSSGCDSVITLNITITTIDSTVTSNGFTLTAAASGYTYRWLDCDDNFAPISGGNQQSYSPSSNGNYAVKISDGSCIDTSACVSITKVGINDLDNSSQFIVYPNPMRDRVTFKIVDTDKNTLMIKVVNYLGQTIIAKTWSINAETIELNTSNFTSGVYVVKIMDNQELKYMKTLIKL